MKGKDGKTVIVDGVEYPLRPYEWYSCSDLDKPLQEWLSSVLKSKEELESASIKFKDRGAEIRSYDIPLFYWTEPYDSWMLNKVYMDLSTDALSSETAICYLVNCNSSSFTRDEEVDSYTFEDLLDAFDGNYVSAVEFLQQTTGSSVPNYLESKGAPRFRYTVEGYATCVLCTFEVIAFTEKEALEKVVQQKYTKVTMDKDVCGTIKLMNKWQATVGLGEEVKDVKD